jgi:hypothetical protein
MTTAELQIDADTARALIAFGKEHGLIRDSYEVPEEEAKQVQIATQLVERAVASNRGGNRGDAVRGVLTMAGVPMAGAARGRAGSRWRHSRRGSAAGGGAGWWRVGGAGGVRG